MKVGGKEEKVTGHRMGQRQKKIDKDMNESVNEGWKKKSQ